ncbi:MAG: hypothetical protein U9R42_10295 [Bacteroidota bacterium]|nr:hypothetical protein [Bacteroidota bacterium]
MKKTILLFIIIFLSMHLFSETPADSIKSKKNYFGISFSSLINDYNLNKKSEIYYYWEDEKKYLNTPVGYGFTVGVFYERKIYKNFYYVPKARMKFTESIVKYNDGIINMKYDIKYWNAEFYILNIQYSRKLTDKNRLIIQSGIGHYQRKQLDVKRDCSYAPNEIFYYHNYTYLSKKDRTMFYESCIGFSINKNKYIYSIMFEFSKSVGSFTNIYDFHFYKALYALPLNYYNYGLTFSIKI